MSSRSTDSALVVDLDGVLRTRDRHPVPHVAASGLLRLADRWQRGCRGGIPGDRVDPGRGRSTSW